MMMTHCPYRLEDRRRIAIMLISCSIIAVSFEECWHEIEVILVEHQLVLLTGATLALWDLLL